MNKYKILKVLGEGSFGSAILAKDDETNELLVLKRIPIKKFSSAALSDAKKEVQVLSSLKHPHITQFFNCYELPEEIIIAMEYCGGGDLKTVIKQRGTVLFPQERILDWFVQLCLAVKYIHDKHILHRDIKSQNIFLTEKGKIKLGDFGIAKTLDNSAAFTNTCVGTPYYISPEICQNMPYNSKSDVWALGCILYEMAALRHPFEASCMKVLITKIMNGSFSPIPSKFSWGFKVLIRQILKSNPNKRPSVTSILAKKILIERVPKFVKDIENNIELLAALRECEDLNDKIRKFSPYASSLSSPPKRKAYNSGNKKNFTPPKHYRRAAKLNSPKVLFSGAQQFNISRSESNSKEIVHTSVENSSLTSVLPKTLENLLSDINNGRYGGFNQSPPKKLKIFRSQVQKKKKNKSKYNGISASSHNSDSAVSGNLVKSKENSKWHEFDHQEASIQHVKSLQTFLVPTSQISVVNDYPNRTNLRACEAAIFPTIGISKESIYSSTPMRRRRKAWSGWDPLPLGEITLETTRSQMDQTSTADEVLLFDIKALNRKSVGKSEICESLTNFSVPSSNSINSEINTRKQWNRDCVDVVNALCNAELLLDNTAATLCNTLHNEMSMRDCDVPGGKFSLTNVTDDESLKENMEDEPKGNVGNHDMCVEMIDNSNDSTMVDEGFFNNILEEKTGEEDLNCSSLSPFVTVRKRSSGILSHSITDKTFVISRQFAQNDEELDNFSSFIEDFNTKEKLTNQVGREIGPDIMKDETNVKDITEESSCLLTSAISIGFDNSILQEFHPNLNNSCPNASVEIHEINISRTDYTNNLNPISFEESCDNEVLHFNDSIDDEIEMKSKSGRSSLLKKLVRRYSNVKLVGDSCSSNKTLESGYGTTSQLNLSLSKGDSKLSTVELSTTGLLTVTENGVVDTLGEFDTKENLTDDEMVCCEVSSSEKDNKEIPSECADTVNISNIKEQEGMNIMHYFSPVCRSLPYNLCTSQTSVENPHRSLNLIDCGKREFVTIEQVDKPLVYKTKFNNDVINCDDSIIEISLTDSGKHFNLGPSSFINLGDDLTKADEDIYLSLDCCETILSDRKEDFESISFTANHEPDSDCCIIEDETYNSCTEDTFDNGNLFDDFKMSSDVLDVNCITLTFPDDVNLPGDGETEGNPKLHSLCMQSSDPIYSSTDNFEDIFGWIEEEKASLEQILGLDSFIKYHSAASSAIECDSVGRFLSTFPLQPTEEGEGPPSRITAVRIVNIVDAERAYDL